MVEEPQWKVSLSKSETMTTAPLVLRAGSLNFAQFAHGPTSDGASGHATVLQKPRRHASHPTTGVDQPRSFRFHLGIMANRIAREAAFSFKRSDDGGPILTPS